ncbi:putative membrane protein [Nakamurella sp. UYEF19]|uniref:SRPBCC family protein n=1 Tax=Nakamurella sp. UYEF19 TaxID=1756392 RepID=UPI003398390D
MGDYEASTTVQLAPERLFAYLSNVQNLPAYMPRLTSARPAGGDKVDVTAHIEPEGGPERDVEGEAWIKVVEDGRKLQWGAAGPHDYHGELDIDAGSDAGSSTLTVRLHTERVEGDQIQHGLGETLNGIKKAVEQADRS